MIGLLASCSNKDSVTPDPLPKLETATLAIEMGTTGEMYAQKTFPKATILTYERVSDAILSLLSRKADYVIASNTECVVYFKQNPNTLMVLPDILSYDDCAIAVSKENPELRERINKIIQKYNKDGTLKKIEQNWIRLDGSDYVRDTIPVADTEKILNVAISSYNEPLCFIEYGEVVGLDIELIKRIAYELDMNFSAMIQSVNYGRSDVAISSLTPTLERAQIIDFTESYFKNPLMVVTRNEVFNVTKDTYSIKNLFLALEKSFYKNFILENRWILICKGIGVTIVISIFSGIIGLLLGFGFCTLRRSKRNYLSNSMATITKVLQGTPVVVLLMILLYVIFNKVNLSGIIIAIIAFGLNFGASSSEIMLSGIKSIDLGQYEAAEAIGFKPTKIFMKIILPQAAQRFIPMLKAEYISLVKMTSVVGYVAVQDLTKATDIIRSRTYEAFFPLIITAILYFLISTLLSSLLGLVEIKVNPKHRARTLKGVVLNKQNN